MTRTESARLSPLAAELVAGNGVDEHLVVADFVEPLTGRIDARGDAEPNGLPLLRRQRRVGDEYARIAIFHGASEIERGQELAAAFHVR